MSDYITTANGKNIAITDANNLVDVQPTSEAYLVSTQGKIKLDTFLAFISAQGVMKVKIYNSSKYGYIMLEQNSEGILSPVYMTEEEFNALS